MATNLVEYFENVDDDYLLIKFEPSLKRSSITNDAFTVRDASATPYTLTDPFKAIDIANDYNSIAKTLKLYWNTSKISANTLYEVDVAGLQNALGMALPGATLQFTSAATIDPDVYIPDDDAGVVITDYSVKTDVFSSNPLIIGDYTSTGSGLWVDSVDPENGAAFLAEDTNNGVVKINFSKTIPLTELTPSKFKVQKKQIMRGPTRWETLSVDYDRDIDDPSIVLIMLPSNDATPVYDTAGATYFEPGYKYRIIVSKDVTA